MAREPKYSYIVPRNGNVTFNGPLEITKSDHKGMPPRTEAYLPGDERGHLCASSLSPYAVNSTVNVVPQNGNGTASASPYPAIEVVMDYWASANGLGSSSVEALSDKAELTKYSALFNKTQVWSVKIEDGAQSAMMSKRLATIITNVPVDYTIEDCRIGAEDRNRLIGLYQKLEFKTYLKKLMEEGPGEEAAPGSVSDDPEQIKIEEPDSRELTDDVLRGLQDGQEIYIDLETDGNHKEMPSLDLLQICDAKTVYTGLADLALLSGKALKLCGCGLEKVWYVLKSRGVDTSAMETGSDLQLAYYVLDPAAKTPTLRDLAFSELKTDIASGTQQEKETQIDLFSAVADPFDEARKSAGLKFGAMMALRKLLESRIEENSLQKVYYDIELPLCKVLSEMEKNGIDVDSEALADFGKELKVRCSWATSCSKNWVCLPVKRRKKAIPRTPRSWKSWRRTIPSSKKCWNSARCPSSTAPMWKACCP